MSFYCISVNRETDTLKEEKKITAVYGSYGVARRKPMEGSNWFWQGLVEAGFTEEVSLDWEWIIRPTFVFWFLHRFAARIQEK